MHFAWRPRYAAISAQNLLQESGREVEMNSAPVLNPLAIDQEFSNRPHELCDMKINEEKTDRCVIISISGRLDTTNYSLLEKKFLELIESAQGKILLECSELEYVSSSGLRVLLMALKKISMLKGKFVLCGLSKNISEIFEVSGFTSICEIYPSRADALRVF